MDRKLADLERRHAAGEDVWSELVAERVRAGRCSRCGRAEPAISVFPNGLEFLSSTSSAPAPNPHQAPGLVMCRNCQTKHVLLGSPLAILTILPFGLDA